jgi:hypothetical protein
MIFGITAGIFAGCILYGKRKILSLIIPAIVATLTTFVMYVGELVLMGGKLFKFGSGLLFEPIGQIPYAPIDIVVILLSGISVYYILMKIQPKVG